MDQVELWLVYMKGLQTLGQLCTKSLWQSLEIIIRVGMGDGSALNELANLYLQIYEQNSGGFLQSPSLGSMREFNNKLLKSFDAWINFQQVSFHYQIVLIDVWMKAFDALMRELASCEETGETVQDWRQFLQVWSGLFDEAFAQTFRSTDAIQIQGTFLNATMRYRHRQQQLMEVFLKMNDLPLRSEIDEIHHSIYKLRKEIKSLKKENYT